VTQIDLNRGYQELRNDEAIEAFGYRDGARNVRSIDRYRVVFVHEDDQPEETSGIEGGFYIAYLRIVQNAETFNALDAETQDRVIGRKRTEPGSTCPRDATPAKRRKCRLLNSALHRVLPLRDRDGGAGTLPLRSCTPHLCGNLSLRLLCFLIDGEPPPEILTCRRRCHLRGRRRGSSFAAGRDEDSLLTPSQ
jgi:hypothetical protein